ncbi:MAG: N-6 DNA methylase, partial [Terriglobales bacterium]
MAESLDERTRATLAAYLREVKSLPNESAKRQRFAALLGELFPGQKILNQFARGIEKLIRIEVAGATRRGYADAYYGNAVIEFENSLERTLADAEDQLREYASGLWNEHHGGRALLAIASDGVTWKMYAPRVAGSAKPGAPLEPSDVALEPLRELLVTEATLGEFWMWLNQVLFRPQQVPARAEWFQHDFGSGSFCYRDALEALNGAWLAVRQHPEAKLAFETWQRYLTVTYGKLPDDEGDRLQTLFLKHTYLCSLARLLVWAALSKGHVEGSLRRVAADVLSGQYFESVGLANLVEDDFFHWIRRKEAANALAGTWERVLGLVLDYDLSHLGEDVLKGVYQQLVDPVDRHDLGEYYTPDWLCERIADQLLPGSGFATVLDPSCGSGGFLRAAIAHFRTANPQAKGDAALRKILESVQGIDIHPVAVTISRATYVLALGPLAKAPKRPIQIPVYLADSLFLPNEVEATLLSKLRGIEISYG